ncbi:MAG: PH domain-containing protein [Alphaproteobacteria bacterium]
MKHASSPEYPKVYRIHLIMRIVVSIAALLFGSVGLDGIIIYDPPRNILAGITFPFGVDPINWAVLLAAITALYIVFRPRVALYADSLEMRGLFRTRRYSRSDIKGISRNGNLLLKGSDKQILMPPSLNIDDAYKNWFRTISKSQSAVFSDDNDAVLTLAKILDVSKGKAGFILFSIIAAGIGLVAYIYNQFPQMHMLGLYVVAKTVGIVFVFVALFCSIIIKKLSQKINNRK